MRPRSGMLTSQKQSTSFSRLDRVSMNYFAVNYYMHTGPEEAELPAFAWPSPRPAEGLTRQDAWLAYRRQAGLDLSSEGKGYAV